MKNLINFFVTALIVSACTNSKQTPETKDPFYLVNADSEFQSDYQLVRPTAFQKNAVDAFGLPIRNNQWYVTTSKSANYLLPVYTDGGTGPNFVENVTRWNKIAILDKFSPYHCDCDEGHDGFAGIDTVEIVCFKDYVIKPIPGQFGMTVGAFKKK